LLTACSTNISMRVVETMN